MSQEEILTGGNVNHIVRMANTVRRPTGYWSPSVQRLLQHIEQLGFDGAPRFLGIDDAGREMLSFIPGDVPGNRYPQLQPHMWSDESLVELAQLLRRFHDATESFPIKAEDRWQLSYGAQSEHEVICHNDAALYNVVFQDGKPVALIDFDMAGPGPRLWDIAYTLYTSVPLASFAPDSRSESTATVEYQSELHAEERRRRIPLFFDSYGIPCPSDLRDWIIKRLTALCNTLRNGAAEGNEAFRKMVDEGHLAHYENEIKFVDKHYDEWL
ncbi:phosphotransferase family enzyme [Paenibacillus taihuensis]|uniref:Phosphotransferase family enzyme n=1 Tax=Paenibacillus taihuensis TaxID=1156355 RepID=A0A3D9QBZ0_9BACL|nr:phosphotransferase [Paenibacillus taihuensis]REE57467.1 phosphotransferase family enzyme [Paenibacillus taihuensis]